MPFFICPNCGNRELSADRTAGFSTRPKGCSKCGFGFVFELLDDYYPAGVTGPDKPSRAQAFREAFDTREKILPLSGRLAISP